MELLALEYEDRRSKIRNFRASPSARFLIKQVCTIEIYQLCGRIQLLYNLGQVLVAFRC